MKVENIKNIEKCNCDRCDYFVDYSEDFSFSYSREEIENTLEELKKGINHLEDLLSKND